MTKPFGGPGLDRTVLVMAVLAVVLYLVGTPLYGLVLGAVTDSPDGLTSEFSLETMARAYGDIVHFRSLGNSLLFSAVTATIILVLGGLLAWTATRTDAVVRHLVDVFALVPVLIPSVVFVSGWMLLLGPKNGILNLFAMQYLGFGTAPFDVFTFAGMIWVATLQELPLAFLWLLPAFRALNTTLEEAALTAGAGPIVIARRIIIPLLWPTLLSSWTMFFIYSMGALMVPIMIGMPSGIIFYSTEIYLATQRVPTDLNLASAYSLLLVAFSVLGMVAYRRAMRDPARYVTVTGKAFNLRVTKLGRWSVPVNALVFLVLMLVAGLPILVLVWNAFMPFPVVPTVQNLERANLANFRAALASRPALDAFGNSLLFGLGAGVVTTVLGVLIASVTLRLSRPSWALALLDYLANLPVAMPGMVIGISLLSFYLMVPLPIFGTGWLFLIAYVTLHLPYAVRICSAGLMQIHHELEEAGRACGASWLTVFRRIVLRLIAPSLLAAMLYVTLRSFREYAASIFLSSPGNQVFSVTVLDMWDTGNFGVLSAYVTMVIALLGIVVAVLSWCARQFRAQVKAS